MSYQFPQDLEARVKAQIASGLFHTEDDVLREAMASLENRQRSVREMREVVGEADADIAAGRVGPFDADETKRAVRSRLADHGITN